MEVMEKQPPANPDRRRKWSWTTVLWSMAGVGILGLMGFHGSQSRIPASGWLRPNKQGDIQHDASPLVREHLPYGSFPQEDDPFHFLPCTDATRPPPLEDPTPSESWASLFNPNPRQWNWGRNGQGIYLCGYLDLPRDYHNDSDPRIVRIAVTKFQVAGLGLPLQNESDHDDPGPGHAGSIKSYKSRRTLIIEPGGPGGSGTSYLWETAEEMTDRFSDGQLDVLGWDPRGVNISLPSAACYPQDAHRDRWSLLSQRYREEAPGAQLAIMDSMNNATFYACQQRLGDFGRFVSTATVARDLEEIRKALDEEVVTGYFVSYGTGIGQTYVNMFPDRAGRLILDGTEYVKDHRLQGGFGWTSLDNATDAWRDGFLGECVNAGPEACALAQPLPGQDAPVTLEQLETRMAQLLTSLRTRPQSAYTDSAGPSLITFSALVENILYPAMYKPANWPHTAALLSQLETGNGTLAAMELDLSWSDHHSEPSIHPSPNRSPSSGELDLLVICSDSYDAPVPELDWWDQLWSNMTAQSWMAGNSRFSAIFPCRHFNTYWEAPSEVYRGDLNHTLKTPVLLIASPYDPATPLRNGRRLLDEMGPNARLIVHHGYGHSSRRDPSDCTDRLAKDYIMQGDLPDEQETACSANQKPYATVSRR